MTRYKITLSSKHRKNFTTIERLPRLVIHSQIILKSRHGFVWKPGCHVILEISLPQNETHQYYKLLYQLSSVQHQYIEQNFICIFIFSFVIVSECKNKCIVFDICIQNAIFFCSCFQKICFQIARIYCSSFFQHFASQMQDFCCNFVSYLHPNPINKQII